MNKYIDLSAVIDIEPELSGVFNLISDSDFIEEFCNRFSKDFIAELVSTLSEDEKNILSKALK